MPVKYKVHVDCDFCNIGYIFSSKEERQTRPHLSYAGIKEEWKAFNGGVIFDRRYIEQSREQVVVCGNCLKDKRHK